MPRDQRSSASSHPDPPSVSEPTVGGKPPFLSQRTTLILFIAIVGGIGIGVLTYLAEKSYPKAVLAGISAAVACTLGLNTLIE